MFSLGETLGGEGSSIVTNVGLKLNMILNPLPCSVKHALILHITDGSRGVFSQGP